MISVYACALSARHVKTGAIHIGVACCTATSEHEAVGKMHSNKQMFNANDFNTSDFDNFQAVAIRVPDSMIRYAFFDLASKTTETEA